MGHRVQRRELRLCQRCLRRSSAVAESFPRSARRLFPPLSRTSWTQAIHGGLREGTGRRGRGTLSGGSGPQLRAEGRADAAGAGQGRGTFLQAL
ncbi:MAG: hypothetical protein MZU95_07885 [Desulfomicrobium escambiense]|nr:hypothetical protein [Desulfomicrobium escambiense]